MLETQKRLNAQESVKPTRLARAWTGECRLGYGVIFGIKCEHDGVSNCRRLKENCQRDGRGKRSRHMPTMLLGV